MAKLFEIQARYRPGTKMPEQGTGLPEDRDALVKFLERGRSDHIFGCSHTRGSDHR